MRIQMFLKCEKMFKLTPHKRNANFNENRPKSKNLTVYFVGEGVEK